MFGGKMCVDHFSDTTRNIPFEEPIFYQSGAGTLMRGGPVFQGPFGIYNEGGRPFIEGYIPYDPSWGGGFRRGPAVFMGPQMVPGDLPSRAVLVQDQYGPLPPSRRPFGGRCDCHYETGHIKYAGGKCYRPWGPKIDPRDSCYDLRNF